MNHTEAISVSRDWARHWSRLLDDQPGHSNAGYWADQKAANEGIILAHQHAEAIYQNSTVALARKLKSQQRTFEKRILTAQF